jgi:hypothetical protein
VRASRRLAIIRQGFCPSNILPVKDVFLRARPGELSLISARNDDFAACPVSSAPRHRRAAGLLAIGDQMIELAIVGPSRAAMGQNLKGSW